MTNPLGFDALQGILHRQIASLPDPRHKGPNTRYTMQDAALGAFGIFFTQSPSFLEYQRRLQHTKGHNNAQTLWASSGFLVTIRSARYSIQSHHAISMRDLGRSLKALNSTTCWHTFGSLATNCWWLWMGPTTFRPKRSTVPTVSPANSPMARPSIIMPPSPR